MPEELPSLEIAYEWMLNALKFQGIEKKEVQKLLQDWTKQEEKKVTTSEGHINLDRKRARLYFEAGYVEEAYNSFEAALIQAWNEGKRDLYDEIVDEVDELSLPKD